MWAQAQQAVSQTLNSEELKQAQERLQETARRGLSQAEQGLEQLKEGELGKECAGKSSARLRSTAGLGKFGSKPATPFANAFRMSGIRKMHFSWDRNIFLVQVGSSVVRRA